MRKGFSAIAPTAVMFATGVPLAIAAESDDITIAGRWKKAASTP